MAEKDYSLKEIQSIALSVLVKFDEICREHGFRYTLWYGTLLGAVRHHGFIPWDDDVDVMMPRSDYNQFIKYAEEHENELFPYKIHTRKNTENYVYGISRFSDMRYKFNFLDDTDKDIDTGVFIDIYPMDNYGNTIEEAKRIAKVCKRYNDLYEYYINPRSHRGPFRTIIKTGLHYALRIIKGNDYPSRINEEIEDYISKSADDNSRYVGVCSWVNTFIVYERARVSDFDAMDGTFEGRVFKIPKEYDYILNCMYGDYMKLPPEEKRHPTHNYYIELREI